MYVEEVSALFLQFCDEQDTTFMTPAQRQLYLKQAYAAFRNEVMAIDAFFYATAVNITVSDAYQYNLAGGAPIIMGPNASATDRLERLLRVAILNDSGDRIAFLERAGEIKQVSPLRDSSFEWAGSYMLANRTLVFDRKFTATMQVSYVAASAVDWTKETSGDNEYIDDLNEWHDIIARLAIKQYYQVRDGLVNEANEFVLTERLGKMRNFLNGGWMQDGANVVFDAYLDG